ncbi:hypothetical protein D9M68_593130 [compost metagenome]
MAVEEASFRRSIDSISCGAMFEMEETGKPSTIYKGVLSPVMEPPPRTRTTSSASGEPSVVAMLTPANLP